MASDLQDERQRFEQQYGADIGPEGKRPRRNWKRGAIGGAVVGGSLLAKFGGGALALLGKLKFLLFGAKFLSTGISALISVAAYALFYGWWFAIGFVALIFVHEMGHWIWLRRHGVPATAPLFIPFLGAAVGMRGLPRDAGVEAAVGLAGPFTGSLGAMAVYAGYRLSGSPLLLALAHVACWINLFNLIPVTPLDGGRVAAALSPRLWIVGMVILLGVLVAHPSPMGFIIGLFVLMELLRAWRARGAMASYYELPTETRVQVAIFYFGLVLALAWASSVTANELVRIHRFGI